jgi:transposase/DNA-binding CsgD family transcriptional regulator
MVGGEGEVIETMEKNTIITLKLRGKSNRWIAKEAGINRKTVARYWNEYQQLSTQLQPHGDNRELQERIIAGPQYDVSSRKPVKYTSRMDASIDAILEKEKEKAREIGDNNKQKLTNRQIHKILRDQGHDIGLTIVSNHIKEKRHKLAEAFIRQEYDFGDRLEYDFGEVRLVINGTAGKYYLAVFGSPRASFRWAYLYNNQKKAVFEDSHVRFFEMVQGVYREMVYDNMRNVVTAFIGKNEKELNTNLIAMSTYYGFRINVTNCFRGNEKGYVESSVKAVRREVFAARYRFDSIEEAEQYLEAELLSMNADSSIEEEMKHLLPWRPPLELSQMRKQRVDKYSFVRVGNNFYSVPEYLVGRRVTVRNYMKEIVIYAGLHEVCRHPKKDGAGKMSVNIFHYLNTLAKKPGAVRNAKALRDEADLKAVFDQHYAARPREFIDVLRANQGRPMEEIVRIAQASGAGYTGNLPEVIGSNVLRHTQSQLCQISDFFIKGGTGYEY